MKAYIFLLILLGHFQSCSDSAAPKVNYKSPTYGDIALVEAKDTIRLDLPVDTYNKIRSQNLFRSNGEKFLSVYEKISNSINIFNLSTGILHQRIPLAKALPRERIGKNTTVYCKNLDSIFVVNELTIYILNRQLDIIDSVDLQKEPILSFTAFKCDQPPIFSEKKMYAIAKPYLSTTKPKEFKKWRTLYEIDFSIKKATVRYPLPYVYRSKAFGYYFFDISYCATESNSIVLSFPADTNIYVETSTNDIIAYTGKSKYQAKQISEVTKQEFEEENGKLKAFLTRDSYGSIYYHPLYKVYMRVAERKLSTRDYMLGKRSKTKTLIFFDSDFKIIGESQPPKNIDLSNIMFSDEGEMYCRIKAEDEYALYFIRLDIDNVPSPNHLSTVK